MKLYNLTLEQNKMISAIINDLTFPYKAHANTRGFENWQKFMNTHSFINASRGYAHNQYKKALSYDDLGERQQIRTAKFVIAFLRVLWQCEQYLLHDEFKCSLKTCDMYDFIKSIKGTPREELDIPLCFAKMEEMDKRLLKAEQRCKEDTPEVYNRKPDIEWIEDFILRAYKEG